MRALQQLTTKCKWRLISIVLEFDWASHIIYEVIIQGVTMEKKHPLSQPSRLHYFQIFFEWLGNFYPFINISTTGYCFSLSLSRLWKLVFIYTKSTKNQRIKNVLFVGFFFFKSEKNQTCRSGNGGNILCSYLPSDAGVNRISSATFGTVSSGRNRKKKNRKRMFYFSEWKCKIADLSSFMSPQNLTLMTEASSQWSHAVGVQDYPLFLFYFRISIWFHHSVRICVSPCACEICMAVCLRVHVGMWKTGSRGMGELYLSECCVFIHGLA